jgi:hypothetical protein
MTPAEARRQVEFYRRHNPLVVQLRRRLDYALNMSVGAGEFRIELPSGRWLEYRNLRRVGGKVRCELATAEGYRVNTLWGGVLTENATQAFARDVFADKLLRLSHAGVQTVARPCRVRLRSLIRRLYRGEQRTRINPSSGRRICQSLLKAGLCYKTYALRTRR